MTNCGRGGRVKRLPRFASRAASYLPAGEAFQRKARAGFVNLFVEAAESGVGVAGMRPSKINGAEIHASARR